jgi:ArsR family transcriptional regulator
MNLASAVKPFDIDEDAALHLAEIFRALADPTRVRMLCRMMDGETNVSALAQAVGISEAGVSHHLRSLRQLRLVRARKQGREVYYSLSDEHVEALLRYGLEHVVQG